MEDMSFQNPKSIDLFVAMLKEKECIKLRNACSKDCADCKYAPSANSLSAIDFAIEELKAKNPELYWHNELTILKELVKDAIESKEAK